MADVHIVYNGHNDDVAFDEMFSSDHLSGLGITGTVTPQSVTPDQVKMAVAQHFDVGLNEFQDHFVEINPNENITVRPQTTFG